MYKKGIEALVAIPYRPRPVPCWNSPACPNVGNTRIAIRTMCSPCRVELALDQGRERAARLAARPGATLNDKMRERAWQRPQGQSVFDLRFTDSTRTA